MPSVRTLGLVVRGVDVFETSLVVTLFTRELGKVGALAKGARRLKSPLQGGLDLLGVSDIVVLHKASEALDLVVCLNPTSSLHPPQAWNPAERVAGAFRRVSGSRNAALRSSSGMSMTWRQVGIASKCWAVFTVKRRSPGRGITY